MEAWVDLKGTERQVNRVYLTKLYTRMWYLTLAAFHSVETTFLGLIKRLPCEGIQDSLGFLILCHGFRFSGT